MLAVDVSQWSKDGPISLHDWQKLKSIGAELAIVGIWHGISSNIYAEEDLQNAQDAGLETAIYIALNPNRNPVAQVRTALGLTTRTWDVLKFIAVDVEIPGTTSEQLIDTLSEIIRLGKRPIIYTSKGFWEESGIQGEFSDIPLWAAQWDGDPTLEITPFGGWGKAVGKQYAGNEYYSPRDISLDWNTFDDEFIKGEEGAQMQTVVDSLHFIWEMLDEIQQLPHVPGSKVGELAERAKQQGVVEIKKVLGIT